LARVEKYALSHLDRVHTITTGATKTAIAWLVALAIIWWQQLEPKFTQVQDAQAGRYALIGVSTESLVQRLNVNAQWNQKDTLAKEEELDLPFSIKIKLKPQWVPTLWLVLAFGLCWYLLVTRKRVLRLAARGLRLLHVDVRAEPAYVRSLVGEAVW